MLSSGISFLSTLWRAFDHLEQFSTIYTWIVIASWLGIIVLPLIISLHACLFYQYKRNKTVLTEEESSGFTFEVFAQRQFPFRYLLIFARLLEETLFTGLTALCVFYISKYGMVGGVIYQDVLYEQDPHSIEIALNIGLENQSFIATYTQNEIQDTQCLSEACQNKKWSNECESDPLISQIIIQFDLFGLWFLNFLSISCRNYLHHSILGVERPGHTETLRHTVGPLRG